VELVGLRIAELDLDRGRTRVLGKGRGWRVVPLPHVLVDILTSYLDEIRPALPDSPRVFANPRSTVLSRHAGALDPQIVQLICKPAGHRAGVTRPHHPRRWRHAFATELLIAGVDVHATQRPLGHVKAGTTAGYLQPDRRRPLRRAGAGPGTVRVVSVCTGLTAPASGPAMLLRSATLAIRRGVFVSAITIRNVDPELKRLLRIRAAMSGHSMEEEARSILRAALATDDGDAADLYRTIRRYVEPLGGVELPLPDRGPMREPPTFAP